MTLIIAIIRAPNSAPERGADRALRGRLLGGVRPRVVVGAQARPAEILVRLVAHLGEAADLHALRHECGRKHKEILKTRSNNNQMSGESKSSGENRQANQDSDEGKTSEHTSSCAPVSTERGSAPDERGMVSHT